MLHQEKRILGISIGTSTIGLAFIKDKILIDWQMKSFVGPWSKYKMRIIELAVKRYAGIHKINAIAVKVPEELRSSKNIGQLIRLINKEYTGKQIPVCLYTIMELKTEFGLKNKIELMEYVASIYPELKFVMNKQKGSKNKYHLKLFEAVAVAEIISKQ